MTTPPNLSRRQFLSLSGLAAAGTLAGCTSSMNVDQFRYETAPIYRNPALEGRFAGGFEDEYGRAVPGPEPVPTGLPEQNSIYESYYAGVLDGGFSIPPVPYRQIDARFYRQEVRDPFQEAPGTIIVDTADHFLYHVQGGGSAIRYGVGLGREGFAWSGRGVIQWKRKWPRWTPPDEMVARQPNLQPYSIANGGMAPGLKNPLGARALYIFQNGQDTLYRVHGTPEWKSIGRSVSSGCVRMMNQDVIHLYDRVRNGSPILVV
ncbi:L,D-transpeptidase family protein [Rhizobium sp. CFBP 8762]|uniref:L,D-transpeptidase family protein n=1 Tax=Rhizobium sp. CFBP 8762 TaxID=2775279 RepID=UPI0017859699|nr:L,D-transpeptidase family protein [Rhizobium sp. CFBP 8762]MBD8556242.1 L,D-transpeptidase family protein [Rhizobium sp. CFBP 8762]